MLSWSVGGGAGQWRCLKGTWHPCVQGQGELWGQDEARGYREEELLGVGLKKKVDLDSGITWR